MMSLKVNSMDCRILKLKRSILRKKENLKLEKRDIRELFHSSIYLNISITHHQYYFTYP